MDSTYPHHPLTAPTLRARPITARGTLADWMAPRLAHAREGWLLFRAARREARASAFVARLEREDRRAGQFASERRHASGQPRRW